MLIIAENTQQGLLGNDLSVTNSALLIVTLLFLDILLSLLQAKLTVFDRWVNGTPLVLVDHGRLRRDRMRRARVDESDILDAARRLRGLERMEQIKFAVLERDGAISIIPFGAGRLYRHREESTDEK